MDVSSADTEPLQLSLTEEFAKKLRVLTKEQFEANVLEYYHSKRQLFQMTDAEKNEMLNMLRSKISELYSTDTAEQLERDSAMLLEDHSSTEDVVNSEVELPRSSSTPEKENETPDTAAEQQERDLVIPLEEHSLTEDDVGQEAAVLHLTGVTPANKDDARRASKRPRVSQNETDSETTQRQSEETSSSADGYDDSSTDEENEPFESLLRAVVERTVVVTPKGKYNCSVCNIDKRIYGRKDDHDDLICPVKLGERLPRPPNGLTMSAILDRGLLGKNHYKPILREILNLKNIFERHTPTDECYWYRVKWVDEAGVKRARSIVPYAWVEEYPELLDQFKRKNNL